MRHPALRRSARHAKRDSRPGSGVGGPREATDAGAQNPAAPGAHPDDGDHNQGGTRPEGLDYQRDLGSEQDA
ncbi:MAG TPA: hypothetical protein VEI25_01385 [Paraburkholderia sp.]|nr:hypothetical protein [Paraburkholderia sp.]